MIHGASAHADEDLVFAELGIGSVFVAQDFGTTKFVNADGFHDFLRDNANTYAANRPLKGSSLCLCSMRRNDRFPSGHLRNAACAGLRYKANVTERLGSHSAIELRGLCLPTRDL